MKTKLHLAAVLLGAAVLLAACSKEAQPPVPSPSAEKSAVPEPRVRRGANGEVIVTLDSATQKLMGLQTAALAPAQLSPELKAYGRVLDISPLAALVADLTTAQAAGEASQAELKRLKTLAAQNNASERALQTAEAAAVRDQVMVESTRLRLLANWGSAIAERPDLPAFVRSLGSLASALVQVDVPAGELVKAMPNGARLVSLANDSQPIEAQFLGPAPMVDPQMQGRGFLFLAAPNTAQLRPGAAVTAFLVLPGEALSGVALPRAAVIRFNGATWVYRQTGEDKFERLEVALEHPLDSGWFIGERLKPQDKVVTVGPQQLLSEELKGQAE